MARQLNFKQILYMVLAVLWLTGCDSQISDFIGSVHRGSGGFTSDNSVSGPTTTPITSLTLSANRPLIATTQNFTIATTSSPATAVSLAGSVSTGTGSVATGAGVTPAVGGSAPVGSGFSVVQNIATTYDSISAFTANLGFSNSPSNSTFSTCSFLGVYSGIACVASASFQLLSTQILGGNLSISSNSVTSNALKTTSLKVKQVAGATMISASPAIMSICGGKVMFSATGASPAVSRAFIYDPVANTFKQEFNTRGNADSNTPMNALCYNDRYIYFTANNSNNRAKKYKYDTQTGAASQVSNTTNDQNLNESNGVMKELSGKYYYYSYNSSGGYKLLRLDPATDNIDQISNLTNSQSGIDGLANFTTTAVEASGRFFFVNYSATITGGELYEYLPAGPSINLLSNTYASGTDNIGNLVNFGDSLYFYANNVNNAGKLYRYKLSNNTMTQVTNVIQNQSTSDGFSSFSGPTPIVFYDNKVFFNAKGSSGFKLYSYNPVDDVVTQITNTAGNGVDDFTGGHIVFNGKLYFYSNKAFGVTKLFRYNATGNTLEQISNLSGSSSVTDNVSYITVYNNRLYFVANNSSGFSKLMLYDEDSNSIIQVSNTTLNAGEADMINDMRAGANLLVFTANTAGAVPGIFALCDSTAGCSLP